jgi:hypothetical protein
VVMSEDEPDLESRMQRERQIEMTAVDGRKVLFRAPRRATGQAGVNLLVNDEYRTSASARTGRNLVMRLEGVLWRCVSLSTRRDTPEVIGGQSVQADLEVESSP